MRLPPERPHDPEWTSVRVHDVTELWDHSIAPHNAAAYAARLGLLSRLVEEFSGPARRVLDVGCAQGTLGLLLAERGFNVTLLDVRRGHIDYARARHERGNVSYCVGMLGPDSPPEDDFDVVLCTEVVEHVRAPVEELLPGLARKTRAGGVIILTTPNADAMTMRLPSYGAAEQGIIDHAENNSADGDAHRFLYTREELVTLVRSIGLRVERTGYLLPFWLDGHLKTRHLHRALYRLRGRPVQSDGVMRSEALARRVCTSQWMVARKG